MTGVSASLTPASASSKVLISGSIFGDPDGYDYRCRFRIKVAITGGATTYIQGVGSGNRQPALVVANFGGGSETSSETAHATSIPNFLHSPNTTSEVTYTVQVSYNGATTFYINRCEGDTDIADSVRGISWITLMEVKS